VTTCVALLRGVNVGKAKRVPMAGLRDVCATLGWADVRTLLNSGNVVFRAPRADTGRLAADLAAALAGRFGFTVPVTVVTAAALDAILADDPLVGRTDNPSRHLVSFPAEAGVLPVLAPLAARDWGDEALAVGARAAYLWCPASIVDSPLMKAVARAAGDGITSRNRATVLKLQALARPR